MAKIKFIIVKKKSENKLSVSREVKRFNVNHLFNDFQIGYEAGKLTKEFPEDQFIIYMEKS
jgi:hypothetical protein